MNSHNKSNQIVEKLELPKDIIMGLPFLSFKGNSELFFENHRGIVRYSDEEILVLTKAYPVCITGRNLYISEYGRDTIVIHGIILRVEFRI